MLRRGDFLMKKVQAYTRTESEAETLSTHLQALGANNVETGSLEEPLDDDFMLMVPLPVNGGTNVMGTTMPASGAAVVNRHSHARAEAANRALDEDLVPIVALHPVRTAAPKDLMHVVSCSIDEQDYDEAVEMIRMNGGYVE